MADAPSSGGSFFTQKYGPLQGWQWIAVIGGAGGLYLYYRQKKAAAAAATSNTGQTCDPTQDPTCGTGPLPGNSQLQPIIIQNGPASTPAPTNPAPPAPAPPGGAPNRLTVANFPQPGLPGEKIVQIIQSAPGVGYALTNFGGVETAGNAPFWGSYLGLPAAARQGGPRTFRSIQLTPQGYRLTDTAGETYNFGKGLKQIGQ